MSTVRRRPFARLLMLLPGCVLVAFFGACASPSGSEGIVIARVDGTPLTLDDALDTFLSSHSGHGSLVQGEAAVRELAGRIVERRLFLDEARSLGLDELPDVASAVDDFRFEQAEAVFWRQRIDEALFVSDTDVQAFYDRTDLAVRCSIVVTADAAAAEDARARVTDGEPFADVATALSLDETADFGGMLPFVQRGELEPALEAQAFVLEEPGQLSPVFACEKGWAFLRLEERITNPNRPSPEEALPQIRIILEERAREDLRTAVEEQILSDVGAAIVPEQLTKATLLDESDRESVVARADGRTMGLGELRDLVALDRVRDASDDEVAEAARSLAREWTLGLAVRRAVTDAGLLELPDVVAKTDRYRDELMLTTLCHDYVYADVNPTEDEIRAYYDERLESEFTRPGEVHLAYILLETPEEAAQILQRLDDGEVFADLAREVSLDRTSAMHGGRIGWAREGALRPEVEQPAFASPIGSIEGPIPTEDGIYVLQIIDRKPREAVTYEQARRASLRRLEELQQKQAWADWSQRLEERARIVFDDDGVRRASDWLASQAAASSGAGGPMAPPTVPDDHSSSPGGARAP